MMRVFFVLFFFYLSAQAMEIVESTANYRVNTTHGVYLEFLPQQLKTKGMVTLHELYAEVELDLSIYFLDNQQVPEEFRNSYEIRGDWVLQKGVVTSALIWDGERILKAKLKHREKARRQFEEVVDRNVSPPVMPRDPILIEEQNGRVSFSIYPAEANQWRRMRLQMLVPYQVIGTEKGLEYQFPLSDLMNQFVDMDGQLELTFINKTAGEVKITNGVVTKKLEESYGKYEFANNHFVLSLPYQAQKIHTSAMNPIVPQIHREESYNAGDSLKGFVSAIHAQFDVSVPFDTTNQVLFLIQIPSFDTLGWYEHELLKRQIEYLESIVSLKLPVNFDWKVISGLDEDSLFLPKASIAEFAGAYREKIDSIVVLEEEIPRVCHTSKMTDHLVDATPYQVVYLSLPGKFSYCNVVGGYIGEKFLLSPSMHLGESNLYSGYDLHHFPGDVGFPTGHGYSGSVFNGYELLEEVDGVGFPVPITVRNPYGITIQEESGFKYKLILENGRRYGFGKQSKWIGFDLFYHSESPVSGSVEWLDYYGKVIQSDTLKVSSVEGSDHSSLWAIDPDRRSTTLGGELFLGPYFGFVDPNYSLLALESDSLNKKTADKYRDSGVPRLTREEIDLESPNKWPMFYRSSIQKDWVQDLLDITGDGYYYPIRVYDALISSLEVSSFQHFSLHNLILEMNLGFDVSDLLEINIVNTKGELIHSWGAMEFSGDLQFRFPRGGQYLLVFKRRNGTQVKKLMVGGV